MYDPLGEALKQHTDAELSALYAIWQRKERFALNEEEKTKARKILDTIAREQDRRHPGFYH